MTKQDEAREAFEKWAQSNGYITEPLRFSTTLGHPNYYSAGTNYAWDAWQAALATLPKVTQRELEELVDRAIVDSVYEETEGDWNISNLAARAILARFPFLGRE